MSRIASSKNVYKFHAAICMAALFFGCVKNPVTGKPQISLISESEEVAMGRQAAQQVRMEFGFVDKPAAQQYVDRLGGQIARVSDRPDLEWHFAVVDSHVVNAFALPGGWIYVTRGLLEYVENEGELAAVLGHEVAHVTYRHSVEQISRAQLTQLGLGLGSILSPTFGQFANVAATGLGLLFLKFSRDDEREADRLGLRYAARAGYDPRQAADFFGVLDRLSAARDKEALPGWLMTHPDPGERSSTSRQTAQTLIQELKLDARRLAVGRNIHLARIDDLVFGENPRHGFTRDNVFYHPDLRFRIRLPQGWTAENTRSAVISTAPNESAQLQLSVASGATSVQQYVQQLAASGYRAEEGRFTEINGNPAFIGIYVVRGQLGNYPALTAFVEYRQLVYQILCVATSLPPYQSEFQQTIASFQALTDPQILRVQPDRIDIRTPSGGQTLAQIAREIGNPRISATELSLLNRIPPDRAISSGTPIKVVVPG